MANKGRSLAAMRLIMIVIALVVISAATASADEWRAFWVDAWGTGFLSQSQVDKLLGVVGDPNSKGDIRNANCNAVFVQVRRRADVCYPSGMGEPYFSGLTPSNFNALQAIINAAHDTTGGKQRIEVHCWIVAFATAGGLVYQQHSDPNNPANYWPTRDNNGNETDDKAFDPGHPNCLEYLTNVCMDLVQNFDIDGIHYDYIRFTANNQGYNPTSVARYNARYGLTGNPDPADERWKQWRRDQVTALVRKVYAKIQATKPWVKQSGAFVTWNPSPTSSTRSAFQATRPYYDVYSDWDSWIQEGIVDMAVPMTYYNWSTYPNDYVRWMNFQKDRKGNRHMIIGPGIYLNSLTNAINEILMTRDPSPAGNYADGFCGYSYRVPYNGGTWASFSPQLVSQVTPTPTNIPVMPWKVAPTKGHISGTVTYMESGQWADGATVTISGPENRTMTCDGTGFYAFIDVTPGTYTITATMPGYPPSQAVQTVALGAVTGNMYIVDLTLGGTAPVITNVQATNITNNSATITWTTNQPASSRVDYGLTTSYGTYVTNASMVTSHSMTLTGLTPTTLYHFKVTSTNAGGTSVSSDFTFTTNGPPTISNVQVSNVGATTATITWTTNTASDSRVNYGPTSTYGSYQSDPAQVTSHTINLTGLTPSTTYHYQCVSSNAYGTAQTSDAVFTTTEVPTEIIVDNTDPGWSNTSPGGGTWSVGTSSLVPKIGTNYLYAAGDGSTVESSVTKKCRWTPNLPVSGYYDVYVFYQIGSNRNESAPFKVYYNGGSVTSIQNQYSTTPNQGGWFLVGSNLPFSAGTSGYVEVSTLSLDTKYVSADAAKWVLRVDTTPPVMNSVTDEVYTTSTTTLQAWWNGSDPESGIQRYEYSVGSSPGATDKKGWTNAGTATSATITGLSLSVGATYYINVRAVNGANLTSSVMSSPGVTVAQEVTSIVQAKGLPDNTYVSLPLSSVSAKFTGSFYIQDSSRTAGIRVESSAAVNVNQLVSVSGKIGLVNGCERAILNCKVTTGSQGPTVKPLAMVARDVGGASFNAYTPGVTRAPGLHNIGLLVQISGRIRGTIAGGFYVDDGSGLNDGYGYPGIRVLGTPPSDPVGKYVKVIGASSCFKAGDTIYPQIRASSVIQAQ